MNFSPRVFAYNAGLQLKFSNFLKNELANVKSVARQMAPTVISIHSNRFVIIWIPHASKNENFRDRIKDFKFNKISASCKDISEIIQRGNS